MTRKGIGLLVFLIIALGQLGAESYRIVPNYGHLDEVSEINWDKERNILLTLGKDGICLAVDLENNRVLNRLTLPGTPLLARLNPTYPELALITEKSDAYVLYVLNWQTGEILIQQDKSEIPFFLDYSKSGEILLLGSEEIHFLAHDSDSELEGPEEVSELLSFGYLGGSEKTFMGYSPSGSLIYYDRFTSKILGQAATEEDLTDLTVLNGDVRLITAQKENTLLLIDRQTGLTLDSLEFEELLSWHVQKEDDLITTLSREKNEFTARSYRIKRDKFSRDSEKKITDRDNLTTALLAESRYLLGDMSGDIYSSAQKSRQVYPLLPSSPLSIESVDFIDNKMLVGSGDSLMIWESPFFEKEGLSTNHLLNLSRQTIDLPLEKSEVLNFQDNPVFWQPDRSIKYPYYLFEYDEMIKLGEVEEKEKSQGFKKEVSFGYADLSFYRDLELLVDENKNCRISRLTDEEGAISREEIYSFSHPSLERAALISPTHLALGSNTYFGGRNSINVTNIYTGESIPLSDERTIVTSFLPDGKEEGFYSFGFLERDEESFGQVKYHRLDNLFEEGELIMEFPQTAVSRCELNLGHEGRVYVSTPEGNWCRSGKEKNESDSYALGGPALHQGYIYRIEKNHSLIISREKDLKPLVTVYFFEGGEWLALNESNPYYFYSSKARELFTVYKVND
ncbi:MAG: hypothetical protein PQJ59_18230 [Spirochaetales bacterium]|nr:hypothetical protein [Spirochaetales bacterium]